MSDFILGPNSVCSQNYSIWKRGNHDDCPKIVLGDFTQVFDNIRYVVCSSDIYKFSGISIGDGSYINYGCFLSGEYGLSIGSNVLVGPYVVFATAGHNIDQYESIYESDVVGEPITVCDDVWIGASAVILPGTIIESGAVVAAASVVKGMVPEYAVVAGVPAKIVKYRRFKKWSAIKNFLLKFGIGRNI